MHNVDNVQSSYGIVQEILLTLSNDSNNGNYLLDTLSPSLQSILHALSHLAFTADLRGSIIRITSILQMRKGRHRAVN